ncbi:MAG: ADOP family duplicated permease [Gemmatimonadaceae bacterium]
MLSTDLRLTLRGFRRAPAFTLGVILTFALSVGATAAMFGLVNRLMLAPPPGVRDAEHLMRVALRIGEGERAFDVTTTSYPMFEAIAAARGVFTTATAIREDTATVGRGADLDAVAVVAATGRYFATLGTTPHRGRLFGPADDILPAGNDVVVLGYTWWQRHYGGADSALGARLTVNGQELTVIGVTPPGFNGTGLRPTDLYVPLSTAMRNSSNGWWTNTGYNLVTIVGRVADGGTRAAANGALATTVHGQGLAAGTRIEAAPLQPLAGGDASGFGTQGRIAIWAVGVALVVLLVATVNVATLLALRAARRKTELAVRVALGAPTSRLVRLAFIEGVSLALAGAAGGLLLSRWFSEAVRATLLPGLAPVEGFVDMRVLALSLLGALVAGTLAGLGPVARWNPGNVAGDLRTGGGTGASRRVVLHHGLVALQMALCTVLLVGAALFVRSMQRVQAQDLGFSTSHLLYLTLDHRGVLRGDARDRAYEEAVRRILTVPGVTTATVVQGTPFGSHNIPPINIPGFVLPPPDQQQLPIMYGATPEYLKLMGVSLRDGRLFTAQDGVTAPLVALVNETMARTAWPGQRAVGRCIRVGFPAEMPDDPMAAAASLPCREVVGVVRDSRARSLRTEGGEAALMQYYIPFPQLPAPPFPDVTSASAIVVGTRNDPATLIGDVQRIVQATSEVPVYARARPYQELIDPQLRSWRLGATLFSLFGALALGIAVVGLFAVVSYLASQREREIGVRLALGGSRQAVGGLVVRDALTMTLAGVAGGLVVSWLAAPLVQSLLFETSARDVLVRLGVALLLTVVAAIAALGPARRASRLDPMVVLRADG